METSTTQKNVIQLGSVDVKRPARGLPVSELRYREHVDDEPVRFYLNYNCKSQHPYDEEDGSSCLRSMCFNVRLCFSPADGLATQTRQPTLTRDPVNVVSELHELAIVCTKRTSFEALKVCLGNTVRVASFFIDQLRAEVERRTLPIYLLRAWVTYLHDERLSNETKGWLRPGRIISWESTFTITPFVEQDGDLLLPDKSPVSSSEKQETQDTADIVPLEAVSEFVNQKSS